MNQRSYLSLACLTAIFATQTPIHAQDALAELHAHETFYGDPPDQHHPWAIHDPNRPQPTIVTPGTFSTQDQPGKPPSDAVILFDGTDLSKWESDDGKGEPSKWIIKDGVMECTPGSGYIRTREKFGDFQLHVEWTAPIKVEGSSQGRGNSGVFLLGEVEVQVLDNYDNPTYADGMAGAVYGQNPPLANALRAPGEFQAYDIVFRRPIYGANGQLIEPGYVTVFENGVVVQDHTIIEGPTGHMARTKGERLPDSGPLKLQDHGNPVRYRNIWYRTLPPRAIEGGTRGVLTTEAATAARNELAASIRKDAAELKSGTNQVPYMLRMAESLVYQMDDATLNAVRDAASDYVAKLKQVPLDQLPAEQLDAKKNEAKHLREVFGWLVRFKLIPADFQPRQDLNEFIKGQGWDKKKPEAH